MPSRDFCPNQEPMITPSTSSTSHKAHTAPMAAVTIFALLAMIVVGIFCRLELSGIPNVKPIAAMALWAAFAFRSIWLPAAALLIVMVVSDLCLGLYALPIAISVYVSLLISCGLGFWIRGRVQRSGAVNLTTTGPLMFASSLVMSTSFFILTNAMVWANGWYPLTIAGLIECYVAAIPFYRFTLIGDLAFTASGLVAWQSFAAMAGS